MSSGNKTINPIEMRHDFACRNYKVVRIFIGDVLLCLGQDMNNTEKIYILNRNDAGFWYEEF